MAVSSTASCFLIFLVLPFCLVAGQSPKYALKGEKANLNPTIPGQPDEILWKHNGNKVVEFDGAQEQVFGTYEGRVTLDWHSADLVIDGLTFEDSGEYELEVFINKRMSVSHYSLKVIDKVAKPTISCNMNNGSRSDTSARLVCSAEPSESQSIMKFEWSSKGNVHPGPQLPISLGEERDEEVYTCSVSNPLSTETATFTAKDCYPVANALVPVTASLVTIIFIILLGFVVWFCKRNKKACFADSEKHSLSEATEDEKIPLDRAPTFPSKQRLDKFNRSLTPNEHARNHKEHTDSDDENAQDGEAMLQQQGGVKDKVKIFEEKSREQSSEKLQKDQLRGPAEDEVPQSENETAPSLLADSSKDSMPKPESSTAAEAPELDKEAPEDEEAKCPPANGPSPTACPSSPLTLNSPDVEHMEDTNAAENVGDNDSSGQEERDESEKSREDKQSSTVLGQKCPETQHEQESDLSQEETDTSKDGHQEIEKTVPAGEIESNSVGDHEEVGEGLDLYSASSPRPESPTPAKADNSNTAQEDPDREEEGETSCISENKGLDDRSASPHDEAPIPAEDGEATLQRQGSVRDRVKRIEEKGREQTSSVKLRADQLRGLAEDEVAETANETGPAGLLPDCRKNLMPELESSTAAEEPESKKEPEEDDQAPSVPASPETSPTAQANSPLTKSSPNVPRKDTTGEESDSD